jgi:lipoprotein-anchoring transpeptidase ErfK/SrfK
MKIAMIAAAVALAMAAPATASAEAGDWIRQSLRQVAANPAMCGAENAAARGTLRRFANVKLPESGKVIVVNIPSGVVTAYENGRPVIESKAVVGGAKTQTPELDTHVTFVRPNPTWTVPQSIIRRKGWIDKLESDPSFFDDNGFDVMVGGRKTSTDDAAATPSAVTGFVQRPGPGNALGVLKIGIENDQAIYLHDTNDPGKFESEVRAASAGCVRVEKVRDIAAWILDVPTSQVDALIDGGDVENLPPPQPVRVILGYWTAWPDDSGRLRFYPDIYNLDGKGASCGGGDGWQQDDPAEDEAPQSDGPRFVPADASKPPARPVPAWTEYQVR